MNKPGPAWFENVLIVLPWTAIPILALHFFAVRSDLPARIAVHFDLNGRPNGWKSPEMFLGFAIFLLIFALAVMSLVMLRSFRLRSLIGALTLIHYLTISFVFVMFWQILDRAAFGRPLLQLWPMPGLFPILVLSVAIIGLLQMRQVAPRSSPSGVLIAEEQHRAPLQLLFVFPGLGVGMWLAIRLPGPTRLLGLLLIAVMAWVGIAVLEGFKYIVRSDGVQVRGFLLPLRFIPRASIHSYSAQPWRGLGYGIRLTSTGTAYIWGGRRVVNIATDAGNVMLGHYAPERLIGELDRMMNAGASLN